MHRGFKKWILFTFLRIYLIQNLRAMKPTEFSDKEYVFQDQNTAKWWRTKLNIQKIAADFDKELKNNMGTFEYILGYQGRYGKHCVYVTKYDPRKKLVVCINSYGNEDKYPMIKMENIENLYRVSCTAEIVGKFIGNAFIWSTKSLASDGNEKLLSDEKKESSQLAGSVNVLDPAVEDLLTKLEMMHLRPIFVEQELTMDDLAELNEDDFGRMGVKKVKDQKKILKGVQECIQKNETVKDKEESCKAINNRAETENNMTASEGREKVVEEGNEFNNK